MKIYRHRTSGEKFVAVEVDGKFVEFAGPLHHSEVKAVTPQTVINTEPDDLVWSNQNSDEFVLEVVVA